MPATTRRPRAAASGNGASAGLVASVTVMQGRTVELGQAQNRPWQKLAWDYWGRLPELHFPTTQLARLITRMNWDVTITDRPLDRTDDDEPDEVDRYLAAVTDGIGLKEAIRLIALNYQVPAEFRYVQEGDDGWNVVSLLDPMWREVESHEDWLRIHAKLVDPRDRRYAMGPFHAILGPAEELLTLEALSRAQARSRISQAGWLLVPDNVDLAPDNPDETDEPEFIDKLMATMVAPIADEHHPSALVPLLSQIPADEIEKIRHLVFERPYDDKLHERIEQVVKRIAVGLDIPAEVLLGIGDVNHWGQWLIAEDLGKNHALPLAENVGEVLARAGELLLEMDEGDIKVTPDPAELFAKRSTVQDAFRGVDRGAVGLRYVRDAMGADDSDAPTQDDLDIIMAMRGRNADTPAQAEEDAGDGAGADVEPVTEEGTPDEVGTPIAAALPGPGASEGQLRRFGDRLADIDASMRDNLIGAMAIAVANARRRVGSKLVTALRHGKRDADAQQALEDAGVTEVDLTDVAAALGVKAFELVDVEETVADTFRAELASWWDAEVAGARQRLAAVAGVDTSTVEWDEAQSRSVALLVDQLTIWAVSQITRRAGEQHAIPAGLAREVVAAAGGS